MTKDYDWEAQREREQQTNKIGLLFIGGFLAFVLAEVWQIVVLVWHRWIGG
jgi:hypothetical protein